jgi:hypothetical protein
MPDWPRRDLAGIEVITPAQAMRLARRFKAACEREESDLGVRLWVADAAADMMLSAGGRAPSWLTKGSWKPGRLTRVKAPNKLCL